MSETQETPQDLKAAVEAALAESDSALETKTDTSPRPYICRVCNGDSPHGSEICEDCEKAATEAAGKRGKEPSAAVAFYPVGPLPLADFETRLELCRRYGVLNYEDHGVTIRFSEEHRQNANAEPASEVDKW